PRAPTPVEDRLEAAGHRVGAVVGTATEGDERVGALGEADDRDEGAGLGAVDVLRRIGALAPPEVEREQVRLASTEVDADVVARVQLRAARDQLLDEAAPA